jgi:ribonuclease P protein component
MSEQNGKKRDIEKKSFAFPRARKLKKQKIIKELFQKSSSVFLHPFKILYLKSEDTLRPKVLISVSKRNFKKAVTRNRIKRQIFEAYRLNEPYFEGFPCSVLAVSYVAKEINTSEFMLSRMRLILKKLREGEGRKKQN